MTAAWQQRVVERKALMRARWVLLCRASDDGMDRAAAASRACLSDAGMRTLLYRRSGSTAWPLQDSAR